MLDYDGSRPHLYQVTNPSANPPTVASVQVFSALSSFYALPDMFVWNNANGTSDVWIADTTTVASVTHGRYSAGTRTWTWDARVAVPGSTGNAFYVNVVWTGARLVVAYSDGTSPWGLFYNWTADPTGASGWSPEGAVQLSSTRVAVVRPAPVLSHDSGLGATVCIYMLGTQIVSRVLADAFSPLLADWGPEQNVAVADVEIAINTDYPYFNNHCAVIDPQTRILHYVHCDSHGGPSPGYLQGTVAVDSASAANNRISWGSQVTLATPSNTAASPAVGVDQSSRVYVFWSTSPSAGSSDVLYTSLTAPYASAGTPVNLTSNAANNNISPHLPRSETMQGFVPLLYVTAGTSAWGTSSPWAVVLDNSIVTANGGVADAPARFQVAVTTRAWTDVGARFVVSTLGTGDAVDVPARFTLSGFATKDVGARFKLGAKPGRPTIFTSTNAAALTLPAQRKVATLCDGSLAVLGWDGATQHLFRVSNAGSATPTVSSVQAFGAMNSFFALPDMLVVNNGSSTSDVWIADTTTVAFVQHGTYSALTQTWSWDTRTAVPGSSGSAYYIQLAWTGAYLVCAYQDGSSHAVFYNYTTTLNGTGGWQPSATPLSSGTSGVRPVTLLLHDAGLGATVCVYNLGSQVTSRVLADSLSPALVSWGPEIAVVTANVSQATVSGGAYAANLAGGIDPASGVVHVLFCDGSSSTRSPGYVTGSATVTSTPASNRVTWSAPIAVGTSAAASGPAVAIDRTSKVFLFWAASTSTTSSDVTYVTATAPYTSVSAPANLTGNAGANSTLPHVPRSEALAGFVPVIFLQGPASPYKVLLDSSITTG